jgi:hypothetical protein
VVGRSTGHQPLQPFQDEVLALNVRHSYPDLSKPKESYILKSFILASSPTVDGAFELLGLATTLFYDPDAAADTESVGDDS